ncbi:MAG: hypothetical protein ACI4NU_07975 [Christensenellales bacterium]
MKKLITLLLVSAFLFAVTIVPAHAVECEFHDEEMVGHVNVLDDYDSENCIWHRYKRYVCQRCGNVRLEATGIVWKTQAHRLSSSDMGHLANNLHRYKRYCITGCGYSYTYTVTCYGPPCQGIQSIWPEIK